MKWIIQIFKSITELSKNNKIFLAVVLLGLMLSDMGFLFFSGFSNGLYKDKAYGNPFFRLYSVSEIKNDEYFKAIDLLLMKNKNFDFILTTERIPTKNGYVKIISTYSNTVSGIFSGRSYHMKLKTDKECVVTRSLVNLNKTMNNIGIEFLLEGNKFIITNILDAAGYTDRSATVFLTISKLRELNFKITKMDILSDDVLNDRDYADLKTTISSIAKTPKWADDEFDDKRERITRIAKKYYFDRQLLYYLLTTIAVLNALLLLRFWLEKRKKELLCYSICGCNFRTLYWLIFAEITIMVLFTELLSITSFELLARKIFDNIGLNIILEVKEYLIVGTLTVLISMAIASVIVFKFLKNLLIKEE